MADPRREAFRISSDPDLVELARRGDPDAFGELVERHRQKCVDLACYYLRNRGEAEDQAQNAFLKAYQHLDQYQGEAEFSTWLARIVANQCLMLMRVQRRARFLYLDETPAEAKAVELPSVGPDPERELAFVQLLSVLKAEIRRIPPMLRRVMLLRDVQGLPMMDVALELGITVSAAKSRLVRARSELRSRMTKHWGHANDSSALSRSAAPLSRVGRHCSALSN
jgi:RNA polymerase sigma-70 factor (ECF subfamily)